MKAKDVIEELMQYYEKMNDEQKAEFRRSYRLVERSDSRKRRDIPKDVFHEVLKDVLEITQKKVELISLWKELQKKLDPNRKHKKAQLKRVLYAAFDSNLSALEKVKYRRRRGRGYRIFEYARDHADELELKPISEEDIELLSEAYAATLSFPRRHRLLKQDRTTRKRSGEKITHDSPAA
jgi:hypothetical protein